MKTLLEVAREVVKIQKEAKERLFILFEAGPVRSLEDRQKVALSLLEDALWQQVYPLGDDYGCSLLLLASKDGMAQVCSHLLNLEGPMPEERSTYANRPNAMGWTPLTIAAQNGFHSVCEVLLLAHADPNIATSGTQLTPLMLASSNGHLETVRMLLGHRRPVRHPSELPDTSRADPWRTSLDGRTALDFARARVRVHRRLAADAREDGRDMSDSYGVRTPHLTMEAEPFLEIDRLLVALTGGSTALGVLRQDFLLGIAFDADEYQGGVMPGGAMPLDRRIRGIPSSMLRQTQITGPRYIEPVGHRGLSVQRLGRFG